MNLPPLHFVTQLWGQAYANMFADHTLMTLMCDGNLPALSSCTDAVYEIYTTKQDWAILENNANFQSVVQDTSAWLEFRFVEIEVATDNSYALMSECHRQAIKTADTRNAAIIFLQPDCLVGNGTLKTVRDKLLEGKRAVLATGMRTLRSAMQLALRPEGAPPRFDMPVRELVALGVRNMHPISKSLVWNEGKVAAYCSHLFWRVKEHSLYARCAHNHPLMVYPRNRGCGFHHTIDWDYFALACPDSSEWHISTSSDEVCLLEMSDYSKFEDTTACMPANAETLGLFLDSATEELHDPFISTPYLYAGEELEFTDWADQNREAEIVIRDAFIYRKFYKSIKKKPSTRLFNFLARIRHRIVDHKVHVQIVTMKHPVARTLYYYPFLLVYSALRLPWRLMLR